VALEVRDLVGGEVEHTTSEQHLDSDTTYERRLLALDMLRLEGCIPTLEFWQVCNFIGRPAGGTARVQELPGTCTYERVQCCHLGEW
jgi:hypothetical protein